MKMRFGLHIAFFKTTTEDTLSKVQGGGRGRGAYMKEKEQTGASPARLFGPPMIGSEDAFFKILKLSFGMQEVRKLKMLKV